MKAIWLSIAILLVALTSSTLPQMRPIGGNGFNPFTGEAKAELSLWTYEGCNLFRNPVNDTTFVVADQLEIETMSSANSNDVMLLMGNISDYEKSKSSWESWSINLIVAGFSRTQEAAKIKEIFKSGQYNVVTYTLDLTSYTFYYDFSGAYGQKGSNLQLSVDRLPKTCGSTIDRWYYQQFFNDYGPTVMSTGTAGTHITFFSVFETELLKTRNASWVFQQTSMWVAYKALELGLSFASNSTEINMDSDFLQKAYLTWTWSGGNVSDYTSNRTRYLQNSYHHPVITGVVPVPIYETIPVDLPQRKCVETLLPEWIANNGSLPLKGTEPVKANRPRFPSRPSKRPKPNGACPDGSPTNPVIPGAFMFQRGYNIIKQQSSIEPLFEYTWGDYEPSPADKTHPEWLYQVPNELWLDYSQWSFNSTLYQSSETARSYFDEIIKVSRSGGFFHSKTKTTIDIISEHLSHNQSFAIRSKSQHLYSLAVDLFSAKRLKAGGIAFTSGFKADVMALPTSLTSDVTNVAQFTAFLDKWGTDYVYQSMFGGIVEMISWFDACMYSTYEGHFVEEQSNLDFIIARRQKGWREAQQKLDINWETYRRVQTKLLGGNAGNFMPDQWDEWATSLYRYPVSYAVKTMSMQYIVNMISPERSAALESARVSYMASQFTAMEEFAKKNMVPQPYTPPSWCKWDK